MNVFMYYAKKLLDIKDTNKCNLMSILFETYRPVIVSIEYYSAGLSNLPEYIVFDDYNSYRNKRDVVLDLANYTKQLMLDRYNFDIQDYITTIDDELKTIESCVSIHYHPINNEVGFHKSRVTKIHEVDNILFIL